MKRFLAFLLWIPLAGAATVPDRYIVELEGEAVAEQIARLAPAGEGRHLLRTERARQIRDRVRAAQRAAQARVEQADATVISSIDTVANALVVRIPEAKAAALARLPGVRRVIEVREFHLLLDHAAPLHRAPEVWNLVGLEKAGAGIKIGIIDTGIDSGHAGFQDPSLTIPPGFPKTNDPSDVAFTDNKGIVARSYVGTFRRPDPDPSARDRVGHGTATAMAAAGIQNTGPLAVISGLAPKAFLGSYKVFGSPGVNDSAPEDAILKAIEDAVTDGMDVLNLSLGTDLASLPTDDPEVLALERAASLGVIVVAAAGNNGPDPATIGSPATGPSIIAVGASSNDRTFSASTSTSDGRTYQATPGSGPSPSSPVAGPLLDVSKLDSNGLACSAFAPGSLNGAIAFILRGVCLFEEKLNNVQQAGALAALVYTDADRPEPITMSVGTATLPAQMVSYGSGSEIKQRLSNPIQATLQFTVGPVSIDPDRLASFSAKGPSVDWAIKPDLVAVGTSLYTAAERFDAQGTVFSADGYITEQGTSFSAPLVAGAAAVIKAARPGLTAAQYRSLLVNTAHQVSLAPGISARIQEAGAGTLDLSGAFWVTSTASPVSLSFGVGGASAPISRKLTISNIGQLAETYQLSVVAHSAGPVPALSNQSLQLAPGKSADVDVSFAPGSLQAGQYDGFISIQGATSGREMRVPYWYGVASNIPGRITILDTREDLQAGAIVNDAIIFRVTDQSGIMVDATEPVVTVVSGGGEVLSVRSRAGVTPGAYGVRVRLGQARGSNVFRIQAGEVTREVTLAN
jgi:subtilisin family serine protease